MDTFVSLKRINLGDILRTLPSSSITMLLEIEEHLDNISSSAS